MWFNRSNPSHFMPFSQWGQVQKGLEMELVREKVHLLGARTVRFSRLLIDDYLEVSINGGTPQCLVYSGKFH